VDQQGHSLEALAQQLRMPAGSVRFPLNFNEGVGVPVAELNRVYNAADVVVTTARGEGFGLPIGTPIDLTGVDYELSADELAAMPEINASEI
jgi:hypothetical protein